MDHKPMADFIWGVADLLRGPYRPPQYERVMLPLTVLRRFDCVLQETKEKVLNQYNIIKDTINEDRIDSVLNGVAKQLFHNHSSLDFKKLKDDPDNIAQNLGAYINGFSANVRDIFEKFEFEKEIHRLEAANRLYLVVSKFCDIDLHPDVIDNIKMGLIFENLIQRFNEQANETAGDYFTPREVIEMMVGVLLEPEDDLLTKEGIIKTIFDPTCGTGGMLAEAQNYLKNLNNKATMFVYGQDYNERAYAIAASDMLIKGHAKSEIKWGDSLTNDQFSGEKYDYLIANPPFGVDWKIQQAEIKREYKMGAKGRFEAGLPRVNDGSLLFLMHMISKFEDWNPQKDKHGSRMAIVFNGSPLFSGGAGSGESEIRRWVIENDWLEAIIAMPEQMFYNTGIGTYVWIITNHKKDIRQGKVQLIDARELWESMRKSQGNKRRKLGENHIEQIVKSYGGFSESKISKIFDNLEFGFNRITLERPLRLKFQLTEAKKITYLENCPNLYDGFVVLEEKLGYDEYLDWNKVLATCSKAFKKAGTGWSVSQRKNFSVTCLLQPTLMLRR